MPALRHNTRAILPTSHMNDGYLEFSHSALGNALVSMLGLPKPPRLVRGEGPWGDAPLAGQGVVFGAAAGSRCMRTLVEALHQAGAQLRVRPELPGFAAIKSVAAEVGINIAGAAVAGESAEPCAALVYDASGLSRPEELRALYDFFQPLASQIPANGRIVIVGKAADAADSAAAAAAAGALVGFVKSLGKEVGRKGTTVNLLELQPGSEGGLAGALRFFLSPHSAFISGQRLALGAGPKAGRVAWAGSLSGKVALVTGAARGIGASISEVLAREGAQVIGVDRPQEEGALGATLSRLNGVGLALDVTAADAGARIIAQSQERFGGLDIVIHNAGITRDKTLRNMPPAWWDQVIEVNLASIVRINEALLASKALKPAARMVCVSSIGGIAGNPGQTNYGATKAGVISYVRSMAKAMAERNGAINAVAPGFIETQMTAHMPAGPRVMGRLMCSLSQGGLPQDIAETVAFLASPYASAVNGQTLRVCGQHLVGA